MKRTPLAILTLTGSPLDVAFQLGKQRARRIGARLDYWNRLIARLFKNRPGEADALTERFLKGAFKASPAYVEEIRALAEGAGVPFRQIFRLNLTELKAFAEKCSTLVLPVANRGKQRVLLAHNEDWDPAQNDVFVLRAKLPGVSYAILTYDGYIPGLSCGFNSFGLAHAVNYVLSRDIRPAMPRAFITRYLVTAKNIPDCLKWMRANNRAFGQSVHLAQKNRYLGVELTAKKIAVWKEKPPAFHTNHYLCPRLKKLAALPSANSLTRYLVGKNLLENNISARKTPFTRAFAQAVATGILSDRSSHPYAIWRDADHHRETSATVATVMMTTGSPEMLVWRKRPGTGAPVKVQLPNMGSGLDIGQQTPVSPDYNTGNQLKERRRLSTVANVRL